MMPLALTGFGLVLPGSQGVAAARAAWAEQRSSAASLPPELGLGFGARCVEFSSAGIIPPMVNRRLDRASRLAWVAAAEALADSGLDRVTAGPEMGIAVATMTAGSEATAAFIRPVLTEGFGAASPLLFPNTVAVAVSGHLSVAFGLRGPGTTVLGRENGLLGALDEASAWLELGLARAVLVVGVDVLFPLMVEVLRRTGWLSGGGAAFPGEGAQAFLVERPADAKDRGARTHGCITWAQGVSPSEGAKDRARALEDALSQVEVTPPATWISGINGRPMFDAAEQFLKGPSPRQPKGLWGEFCGSGGQLLAAGLLEGHMPTRITLPASRGSQGAIRLEP